MLCLLGTGERGLFGFIDWGLCREGLFGIWNPGRMLLWLINACLDDARSVVIYWWEFVIRGLVRAVEGVWGLIDLRSIHCLSIRLGLVQEFILFDVVVRISLTHSYIYQVLNSCLHLYRVCTWRPGKILAFWPCSILSVIYKACLARGTRDKWGTLRVEDMAERL